MSDEVEYEIVASTVGIVEPYEIHRADGTVEKCFCLLGKKLNAGDIVFASVTDGAEIDFGQHGCESIYAEINLKIEEKTKNGNNLEKLLAPASKKCDIDLG